jgi:NAD+ kinase
VKPEQESFFQSVIKLLEERKMSYCISQEMFETLEVFQTNTPPQTYQNKIELDFYAPDFMISFGGDGTILDTVLLTKDSSIPVLGVNLGRLGFLANTSMSSFFEIFDKLERGAYKIEDRMLLEVNSNIPIFINENIALNDLAFLKANSSSMIEVETFVNGEYLNTYFADGLIVSTSTGSTGYSLSCGGPILHPLTNSFVITPIAPHNLNMRPIVLPDSAILSFKVKGRSPEFLCTLDSRSTHITSQNILSVQKSKDVFKLIQIDDDYFIKALKHKLNWGK